MKINIRTSETTGYFCLKDCTSTSINSIYKKEKWHQCSCASAGKRNRRQKVNGAHNNSRNSWHSIVTRTCNLVVAIMSTFGLCQSRPCSITKAGMTNQKEKIKCQLPTRTIYFFFTQQNQPKSLIAQYKMQGTRTLITKINMNKCHNSQMYIHRESGTSMILICQGH